MSDTCTNCDGRKCMGCVVRDFYHDCMDDCPDCCAENLPVTYPGGTQWAVRYRHTSEPYCGHVGTEESLRRWFNFLLAEAKKEYPDRPELWPELVRADITWQVVDA